MEKYIALDFQQVKANIAVQASFDLSKQLINEQNIIANKILLKQELANSSEILKLYKEHGSIKFKALKDITHQLNQIKKGGSITPKEINLIKDVLETSIQVDKFCNNLDKDYPLFKNIVSALSNYTKVIQQIEKVINNDGEIKKDASEKLINLHNQINDIEMKINDKVQMLLIKYKSSLMEQMSVNRNGRICLLVKISDKNKIKGLVHDVSASGQAVYLEPNAILDMNNDLQTCYSNVEEEENRLVNELIQLIKPDVDKIQADLETITLIDSYFAKAKWCDKNNGTYASLSNEKQIKIKQARHPLIDAEKVVANDYNISQDIHTLIISGSNTGGKSVTLKTIGLFTLLSLCALPLSCEEALIYPFKSIFMDIGDGQSVIESLSTFSAHLTRIAIILQQANEESLVLIDELGSGTDPKDGESLALAILDELVEKNSVNIITTHFEKVKERALTNNKIEVGSVLFDDVKMQPTYQFNQGVSGASNALLIAKRYGISDDIIAKAQQYQNDNLDDLGKKGIELAKKEQELAQKAADLQQQFEEQMQLKIQMEKDLRHQQQQSQSIIQQAQQAADEKIAQANQKIDAAFERLKQQNNFKQHEKNAIKDSLKDKESTVEKPIDETITVGDYVKVEGLNYRGEVLSIKGKNATVNCNGIKTNIKISQLTKEYKPKPINPKKRVEVTTKKISKAKMECNIIGYHVSEGLEMVNKYIDNCLYHKQSYLRIIHGNGSGKLRSAVHDFLKKNKYVKEYRLGGENEGGSGATVVTLKTKHG